MKRLNHHDGTWQKLLDDWSEKCRSFDEDFESYMSYTLPTLAEQCKICESDTTSGVYAHTDDDDNHIAICFLNAAYIPKFTGRVLRVRHLILGPNFDFGEYSADQYAQTLSRIVEEILTISDSSLECEHIKIHFRSPADVAVFKVYAENMMSGGHFKVANMVGSWLLVTKN